MKRGVPAVVLVFVVFTGIPFAGAVGSVAKGQIGGPPDLALGSPDEGTRTTAPLVIGRGETFNGPVEIVGYGWSAPKDSGSSSQNKLCVWMEYPPREINFATCDSMLGSVHAMQIDNFTQIVRPRGLRSTEIGGRLGSGVVSVQIVYRRPGGQRFQLNATVAQVSGQLQKALKQPAPFGYFVAKVRGLIGLKAFRVQAFDATGHVVGSLCATASRRTNDDTDC